MNIPISDIFEALFIFSISLWMLFDGWRMYFKEEKILLLVDQLGFLFTKLFWGSAEANRRLAYHITPRQIKKIGLYSLLAGGSFLIFGVILFIDALFFQ